MKENIFQALIAAVVGAVAAYFNVLLIPLIVLFVVMVIDYITGMAEAYTNKTINSRIGIVGILKKVLYFALVAVGIVADYLITSALVQIHINLEVNYCIGMIVTIWLIINELISILENLSEMGIPLPEFLIKIVKRLKNTVDKESEE